MNESDVARFWAKVRKTDACWIWLGGVDTHGYGHINIGGRVSLAHRLAWNLASGEDPGSLHVLHRCDTPECVNPEHLFLGTHADNMRDRDNKRRGFNSRKTHCPKGHEYNDENTINSGGRRTCRACRRLARMSTRTAEGDSI